MIYVYEDENFIEEEILGWVIYGEVGMVCFFNMDY